MVDTKPLLKSFGATVDVAGQIATDKSINSRRQSKAETAIDGVASIALTTATGEAQAKSGRTGGVDITNGQLVGAHDLSDNVSPEQEYEIQHTLGRVPVGAIILMSDTDSVRCESVSATAVTFNSNSALVNVWIF
jgi:hypothetical protein